MNKPLFGKPMEALQARNRNRLVRTNTPSLRYKETYHLFDNGGGYYTVEGGQPKLAAEGGVMRAPGNGGWYIMRSGEWRRIKYEEVPAEVKATILLLELKV